MTQAEVRRLALEITAPLLLLAGEPPTLSVNLYNDIYAQDGLCTFPSALCAHSHPPLLQEVVDLAKDLKQFVFIRKISGGTKSVKVDKSLTRHLSVIQTAQKRGLDVYHTLHGLLMGTLHPSVLTTSIS